MAIATSVTVKPTMNTDVLPVNADTILLLMESVKLWNWDVLDIKEVNALIVSQIINSREVPAIWKDALILTALPAKNVKKNTIFSRVAAE